jgi:hypothetical protein
MNENDLSDEAFREWVYGCAFTVDPNTPLPAGGSAWREAVRRAKANPWQFFSDEDLNAMADSLPAYFILSISGELQRRQAK